MTTTLVPFTGERAVSASILRTRMRSPFLATLALYARFEQNNNLPLCTNGYEVFYSDALANLSPRQADAALLHQVLHAAMLHPVSRGVRDPHCWNLAADIVVNGILATINFVELPADAVRAPARR